MLGICAISEAPIAAPAVGNDRYWIGDGSSTDWSEWLNWSAHDGGLGGSAAPTAADAVVFDANGVGNCILDTAAVCASFELQSDYPGDFDPNAQAITIEGDCTVQAGAKFATDADAFNGSTWIIGGAFNWQGESGNLLKLNATAAWALTVAGSGVARYVETEYSDAGGGQAITANDGTIVNGGNNINWAFTPPPFSVRAGAIYV